MPPDTIRKMLLVALSAWALSLFGFWFYLMHGAILFGRASRTLLRQVREVSEETFDYLHRGGINSAFGVVPYATINASCFNAFVKSEELNEYSNVQIAKVECRKAGALNQRNLIIWLALFGYVFVLLATAAILLSTGILKS